MPVRTPGSSQPAVFNVDPTQDTVSETIYGVTHPLSADAGRPPLVTLTSTTQSSPSLYRNLEQTGAPTNPAAQITVPAHTSTVDGGFQTAVYGNTVGVAFIPPAGSVARDWVVADRRTYVSPDVTASGPSPADLNDWELWTRAHPLIQYERRSAGGAFRTQHTSKRYLCGDVTYPPTEDARWFLSEWVLPNPEDGNNATNLIGNPAAGTTSQNPDGTWRFVGPVTAYNFFGSYEQAVGEEHNYDGTTAARGLGLYDGLNPAVTTAAWPPDHDVSKSGFGWFVVDLDTAQVIRKLVFRGPTQSGNQYNMSTLTVLYTDDDSDDWKVLVAPTVGFADQSVEESEAARNGLNRPLEQVWNVWLPDVTIKKVKVYAQTRWLNPLDQTNRTRGVAGFEMYRPTSNGADGLGRKYTYRARNKRSLPTYAVAPSTVSSTYWPSTDSTPARVGVAGQVETEYGSTPSGTNKGYPWGCAVDNATREDFTPPGGDAFAVKGARVFYAEKNDVNLHIVDVDPDSATYGQVVDVPIAQTEWTRGREIHAVEFNEATQTVIGTYELMAGYYLVDVDPESPTYKQSTTHQTVPSRLYHCNSATDANDKTWHFLVANGSGLVTGDTGFTSVSLVSFGPGIFRIDPEETDYHKAVVFRCDPQNFASVDWIWPHAAGPTLGSSSAHGHMWVSKLSTNAFATVFDVNPATFLAQTPVTITHNNLGGQIIQTRSIISGDVLASDGLPRYFFSAYDPINPTLLTRGQVMRYDRQTGFIKVLAFNSVDINGDGQLSSAGGVDLRWNTARDRLWWVCHGRPSTADPDHDLPRPGSYFAIDPSIFGDYSPNPSGSTFNVVSDSDPKWYKYQGHPYGDGAGHAFWGVHDGYGYGPSPWNGTLTRVVVDTNRGTLGDDDHNWIWSPNADPDFFLDLYRPHYTTPTGPKTLLQSVATSINPDGGFTHLFDLHDVPEETSDGHPDLGGQWNLAGKWEVVARHTIPGGEIVSTAAFSMRPVLSQVVTGRFSGGATGPNPEGTEWGDVPGGAGLLTGDSTLTAWVVTKNVPNSAHLAPANPGTPTASGLYVERQNTVNGNGAVSGAYQWGSDAGADLDLHVDGVTPRTVEASPNGGIIRHNHNWTGSDLADFPTHEFVFSFRAQGVSSGPTSETGDNFGGSGSYNVDDAWMPVTAALDSARLVWLVENVTENDLATNPPTAGSDQRAIYDDLVGRTDLPSGFTYIPGRSVAFNEVSANLPDPFASTPVSTIILCAGTTAASPGRMSVDPGSAGLTIGRQLSADVKAWLLAYYRAGGRILAMGCTGERWLEEIGMVTNRSAFNKAVQDSSSTAANLGYRIASQVDTRDRRASRFAAATTLRQYSTSENTLPGGVVCQGFQVIATGADWEEGLKLAATRGVTGGVQGRSYPETDPDGPTRTAMAVWLQYKRKATNCGKVLALGMWGRSTGATAALNGVHLSLLRDAIDYLCSPSGFLPSGRAYLTLQGSAIDSYTGFNRLEALTLHGAGTQGNNRVWLFFGVQGANPNTLAWDTAPTLDKVSSSTIDGDWTHNHTLASNHPTGLHYYRGLLVDSVSNPIDAKEEVDYNAPSIARVYNQYRIASSPTAYDDDWAVTGPDPADLRVNRGETVTGTFVLFAGYEAGSPLNSRHVIASRNVNAKLVGPETKTNPTTGNASGVHSVSFPITTGGLVGDYGLTVTDAAHPTAFGSTPTTVAVSATYDVASLILINASTIPASPDFSVSSRLTAELGFFAWLVTGVRGDLVNAAAVAAEAQDTRRLVSAVQWASTTGADGWTDPADAAWSAALPGGVWDISATATKDGNTGVDESEYVLLANDPNLALVTGIRPTDNSDDHFHPGDALHIDLVMLNPVLQAMVEVDSDPAPTVSLCRFSTAGRLQYLESDLLSWTNVSDVELIGELALTVSPNDAKVWQLDIAGAFTAQWDSPTSDFFAIGKAAVSGTPYATTLPSQTVSSTNRHDRNQIDPLAFALHGVVSHR